MKLFEYAVIYNPLATKEQKDAGESPKSVLLVEPTFILANNDREANMLAARSIPVTHTDKLDRLEIVCRPF